MNLFGKKQQDAPAPKSNFRLGGRKHRLLSESSNIEDELLPNSVRMALWITTAIVVLFVLWAEFTNLTEVARAPGEIAPSGHIKVVQHISGGVVSAILVEEKALVEKDQVLVRLDGSQAVVDLHQMEERLANLKLRNERLSALAAGRAPDFAAVGAGSQHGRLDQERIYEAQMSSRSSALAIVEHQIEQRRQRISQLQNSLTVAREQMALSEELVKMREDLATRHLINKTLMLETKRANIAAAGEVQRITLDVQVAMQELGEANSRAQDIRNQLHRDASGELGVVQAEITEAEVALQGLRSKVERLEVRSPVRGYVQDKKVDTVGQVLSPGATLMQIVPDNIQLEATLKISPRDIAYVKVGQPVEVRVTSYDFSRYGFSKGTLKRISASSLQGEGGESYYRAWVELEHPYVGTVPGRYPLQAGMSVEAAIVTGQKSLLSYLTKPITSALSSSFRER
ncbi:MAG: HlyD family type I secretion periplasmic adaptor subunit [Pseudomonadota bacterium]